MATCSGLHHHRLLLYRSKGSCLRGAGYHSLVKDVYDWSTSDLSTGVSPLLRDLYEGSPVLFCLISHGCLADAAFKRPLFD